MAGGLAAVVESNPDAFRKLAIYSALIFAIPLGTLAFLVYVMDVSLLTGGIVAVILVNVVLIAFVLDAFSEETPAEKAVDRDSLIAAAWRDSVDAEQTVPTRTSSSTRPSSGARLRKPAASTS